MLIDKLKSLFSYNSESKHEKDFSWKKSKKNPYKKNEQQQVNWKLLVYVTIFLSSFISLGYLLFFSNFFLIKNIEVTGVNRIDETELRSSVQGIYSYDKFFVFPGNNYFLLDKKEIKGILKKKYPIETVELEKRFPDNLKININEKISTIIYDNGRKYATVGLNGKVIKEVARVGEDEWSVRRKRIKTTSTNKTESTTSTGSNLTKIATTSVHTPKVNFLKKKQGKYPILYDSRNKTIKPDKRVLKQAIIEGVTTWYQLLTNRSKFTFKYGKIKNSVRNLVIFTDKFKLKVTPRSSKVQQEFINLKRVLESKINNLDRLKYIDVRYQDKVYWK